MNFQKIALASAIILLAGCSVGGVELTKEAAFCEINGETFRSGENIPLADGCNSCTCSADGELAECTENDCAVENPPIGMANPASVKCAEDGFEMQIRTAEDGSQSGVCIDAAGNECEEWAYFRGECAFGTDDLTKVEDGNSGEENSVEQNSPTDDEIAADESSAESSIDADAATESSAETSIDETIAN